MDINHIYFDTIPSSPPPPEGEEIEEKYDPCVKSEYDDDAQNQPENDTFMQSYFNGDDGGVNGSTDNLNEEDTTRRVLRKRKAETGNKFALDSLEEDCDWNEEPQTKKKKRTKVTEVKMVLKDIKRSTQNKPGKKQVSGMTPEELTRESSRKQKQRKSKNESKISSSSNRKWKKKRVSEMTPEELEASRSKWRRQKKKTNEMTPEELEKIRARWREQSRRKQERMKQDMIKSGNESESNHGENVCDKLAQFREKARERMRRRREQMTPEEKEEQRQKVRERHKLYKNTSSEEKKLMKAERVKQKRKQLTPEEKNELLQRNKIWYLENRAKMTEEQLAEERMKAYMRYVARQARLTPEEREKEKQKKKLARQRRWQNMTEEERKKKRESVNQTYKNYRRSATRQRSQKERSKTVTNPNETPEQRRERLKRNNRKGYHRKAMKRKLQVKEMLEKGMTLEEINQKFQNESETHELRERRLKVRRKWLEKTKLKRKLIASGASNEEIEAKLKEFLENYQFTGRQRRPRKFKLQPERWKTFEPEELKMFSNLLPSVATLTKKNSPSNVNGTSPAALAQEPISFKQNLETDTHSLPAGDAVLVSIPSIKTPESQQLGVSLESSHQEKPLENPSQDQANVPFFDDTFSPSPPLSPSPPSPPIAITESQQIMDTVAVTTSISKENSLKSKGGRPKKGGSSPPKKTKGPRRCILGQPIGPIRKIAGRDSVCDECGNAYSSHYLKVHKRNMHNSHFKNGECSECGEKFNRSDFFYLHWKKKHCTEDKIPQSEKKFMCEDCGKSFSQAGYLKYHWHHEHGPGSHENNFHKCSLCPPNSKKLFKSKFLIGLHMQRCHRVFEPRQCVRCPEKFQQDKELNNHVMENHPDSYWSCKYCGIVKYSEWALKFHFSVRKCQKIPKEEWAKWRKDEGNESIERFPLQCELCPLKIFCIVMRRHYEKVHGIKEDDFQCVKCDKIFKKREYWGIHMIEVHNMDVGECKQILEKINLKNGEQLNMNGVLNKKGGRMRVKLDTDLKHEDLPLKRKRSRMKLGDEEEKIGKVSVLDHGSRVNADLRKVNMNPVVLLKRLDSDKLVKGAMARSNFVDIEWICVDKEG